MIKYVLASEKLQEHLLKMAGEWAEESAAVGLEIMSKWAVAEWEANRNGFTLHKHRAHYPKETS